MQVDVAWINKKK